jgi:flagellar biosynthesis GTPase FlhF
VSIHTLINSNITDYGALTAVLDQGRIPWQNMQMHDKQTGHLTYEAIQARIGNETVSIFRYGPGQPFTFQSEGWWFRNDQSVSAVMARAREEVSREQVRREQFQRRQEERSQVEAERQAREQERQRRIEEQRDREEEERQRVVEEQRQIRLSKEAQDLLAKLDTEATNSARTHETSPHEVDSLPRPISFNQGKRAADPEQLSRVIGKLHQQNARNKILSKIEEIEDGHGLFLHSEMLLEDESIELVLRG